ncbi:restriction endonuclease subunit S [Candidatus Pacearchaeota archaeon]|nr:restriction endonuclease subunit S [Candidatus Pacearchaeota archaeon]
MKNRISSFLKEREDRFKPNEANKLGLMRLNKIDFSGKIHLVEKPTNTNMILVKSGDLVISGINVEKGAVAVYQGEEDILATIHYSSYEFDESKIDINYFKWFLKSDSFRKIVQSQTRGGIKTELKSKKFLPLEIDLPDLKSQKQILTKINSIKNEIKELEQTISHDEKLLKNLKQSILQEAVQGKLVPQNPKEESAFELLKKIKKEKEKLIKEGKIRKGKELPPISDEDIPYELPRGWEWCRLGDILELIMGQSPPSSSYNKNHIGIPFYQGKSDFGKVSPTPRVWCNEPKKIAIKNDILICVRAPVGPTNLCQEESCIGRGLSALRPILFSYNYLLIFFKAIEPEFSKKGFGSTFTAITKKDLENQIIGFPPLAEQKRIVEKVDALMEFCDELELKIEANKKDSEVLMGAVLGEVFGR